MNKKIVMMTAMALAATMVIAAPKKKPVVAADEDAPTTGKEAKILINQFPRLGNQATLSAPNIGGQSIVGACYTKPRKWIVLETKSATENKGNKEGLAPYSYFTTSVTYQNIPQGSHAASVCLHPSYLERYGEAKAIGLVITNAKGEILQGDSESEINGIAKHTKWWENQEIMNKQTGDGKPMIERRQGLMDRSKTIWALVNPNDYEQVAQ